MRVTECILSNSSDSTESRDAKVELEVSVATTTCVCCLLWLPCCVLARYAKCGGLTPMRCNTIEHYPR